MEILGIVGSLASILGLAIQTAQMTFEWVVIRLGNHQRGAKLKLKFSYMKGGVKAKLDVSIDEDSEAEMAKVIVDLIAVGSHIAKLQLPTGRDNESVGPHGNDLLLPMNGLPVFKSSRAFVQALQDKKGS